MTRTSCSFVTDKFLSKIFVFLCNASDPQLSALKTLQKKYYLAA